MHIGQKYILLPLLKLSVAPQMTGCHEEVAGRHRTFEDTSIPVPPMLRAFSALKASSSVRSSPM